MLCCIWPSLVDLIPKYKRLILVDLEHKYKKAVPAGLEAVEWREKLTAKSVDASPSCYLLGAEGQDRVREKDKVAQT